MDAYIFMSDNERYAHVYLNVKPTEIYLTLDNLSGKKEKKISHICSV